MIREENPDVTGGALSNVRGNWYEWLIALGFLEFRNQNPNSRLLLQLPNISQYDCARLYIERIYGYIIDLRAKVGENADVSLITSNPDFVIVSEDVISIDFPDIEPGNVKFEQIEEISKVFTQIEHACSLNDIIGYLAVKSSLRPDRRLQIAHEGSLMKALYKHVQTREWIINAPGIKYYAVTTKASAADRRALKTVATHSVVDVSSKPQAAVDDLYCVSSGKELKKVFEDILI